MKEKRRCQNCAFSSLVPVRGIEDILEKRCPLRLGVVDPLSLLYWEVGQAFNEVLSALSGLSIPIQNHLADLADVDVTGKVRSIKISNWTLRAAKR